MYVPLAYLQVNKQFTLFFLLSHHSTGLAKNACHNSPVEPVLFAALFPFLPVIITENRQDMLEKQDPAEVDTLFH